MTHLKLLAILTAISLACATASPAQTRGADPCRPGTERCVGTDKPAGKGAKAEARKIRAPSPGDTAKGGQRFDRAANSRFKAPPRGQEYRVLNDHLVLVNSDTLRIVRVLGDLGMLLK